jgi:acyl carrier protein
MNQRMRKEEILEKLKSMLHERFSIDPAGITGETRRADMGLDSILMVDLMLDVESEMGITFDTMDLPPNPSLNDVSELISRALP